VAWGSDYPFFAWEPLGDGDIFGRAVAVGACSEAEANAIRGVNGLAFLGLKPGDLAVARR